MEIAYQWRGVVVVEPKTQLTYLLNKITSHFSFTISPYLSTHVIFSLLFALFTDRHLQGCFLHPVISTILVDSLSTIGANQIKKKPKPQTTNASESIIGHVIFGSRSCSWISYYHFFVGELVLYFSLIKDTYGVQVVHHLTLGFPISQVNQLNCFAHDTRQRALVLSENSGG
jgi:hypothetical protein